MPFPTRGPQAVPDLGWPQQPATQPDDAALTHQATQTDGALVIDR
ncbi:hypothetical protein U5801_26665 [Lamprobacter modestohalophilus]|nr:hypothetical protein [Lamprobacter modestohalophilus]MEA1053359.1 hypothetical protein [Lamprobacter modestohalophilus]